jgi:DNA-binding response OmpR family regulator
MPSFTDAFEARILIVDDTEANVRLLEFTLRRAGYLGVSSATEPRQVAALHRQNRYDLILLDLQMPRMNGFQVMAALSEVEEVESPAVLVLSADPSQSLAALAAGATDFLSKPFNLTELLLRVRRLLETRMLATIVVPLVPAAALPPHVMGV